MASSPVVEVTLARIAELATLAEEQLQSGRVTSMQPVFEFAGILEKMADDLADMARHSENLPDWAYRFDIGKLNRLLPQPADPEEVKRIQKNAWWLSRAICRGLQRFASHLRTAGEATTEEVKELRRQLLGWVTIDIP